MGSEPRFYTVKSCQVVQRQIALKLNSVFVYHLVGAVCVSS